MKYQEGDLFDMGFPAIAHGANCVGVMGAGIAKQVRRRWPVLYSRYRADCADGVAKLGSWTVYDDSSPIVYNLFTQFQPGPNADLVAIERSLLGALWDCEDRGIDTLGIPMIGAGIGGLRWEDVAEVVQIAESMVDVQVVVAVLPGSWPDLERVRRCDNCGQDSSQATYPPYGKCFVCEVTWKPSWWQRLLGRKS